MPAAEPLGKQSHFPPQQRIVIRWQLRRMRAAARLNAHQRFDRIRVQAVSVALPVELHQVRLRAEIGVEQEAFLLVAMEHARGVHAHVDQHRGDADVRLHVFLGRRRIHGDPAFVAARDAKIAAEAGVRGGCRDLEITRSEQLREPLFELFEPQVSRTRVRGR
jgi:hypothetical protein